MQRLTKIIVAAAVLGAGLLVTAPSSRAHHSGAMFDDAKVTEVTGVVKELQWTNPHIWIQVIVEDKGTKTEWSIEGGSPNSLSRNGWRRSMFNPGDVVSIRLNPMKDGTPAGGFVGAKFADGKTIGRWQ